MRVESTEQLTGLRGVAAFALVLWHYEAQSVIHGQLCVMLFFMLSGFLMGLKYINLPFTASNIEKFTRARVARVVPIYLVCVLVYYMLFWHLSKLDLLWALLFIHAKYHLWTVPVEVQFYAFFIFLWYVHTFAQASHIARQCRFVMMLYYIAALLNLAIGKFLPAHTQMLPQFLMDEPIACINHYKCSPAYVHVFAIGTLLGATWTSATVVVTHSRGCWLLFLLLLFVVFNEPGFHRGWLFPDGWAFPWDIYHFLYPPSVNGASASFWDYASHQSQFIVLWLDPVKVALCAVLILHAASCSPMTRVCEVAFLQWVGRYSFGLYLFHQGFLLLALSGTLLPESRLLAFLLSCLLAWLSFEFFEVPVGVFIREVIASSKVQLV